MVFSREEVVLTVPAIASTKLKCFFSYFLYVFVPLEVQPVYKEADIINVQINFYELNPAI